MTNRYSNKSYSYMGLFLLLVALAGCQHYPPPSKGGYGYAAYYDLSRVHYVPGNPIMPYQPYIQKYKFLINKLHYLNESQVKRCYPARMVEMGLLSEQIAEEIMANLLLSVKNDLNLLENNINAVWQFQNVKACPKLKDNRNWKILKARIQ